MNNAIEYLKFNKTKNVIEKFTLGLSEVSEVVEDVSSLDSNKFISLDDFATAHYGVCAKESENRISDFTKIISDFEHYYFCPDIGISIYRVNRACEDPAELITSLVNAGLESFELTLFKDQYFITVRLTSWYLIELQSWFDSESFADCRSRWEMGYNGHENMYPVIVKPFDDCSYPVDLNLLAGTLKEKFVVQ